MANADGGSQELLAVELWDVPGQHVCTLPALTPLPAPGSQGPESRDRGTQSPVDWGTCVCPSHP